MADKYKKRLAEGLESQGYQVLQITGPWVDFSQLGVNGPRRMNPNEWFTPPDRRRYLMRAQVWRPPREVKLEVPDEAVPDLVERGYRVKD